MSTLRSSGSKTWPGTRRSVRCATRAALTFVAVLFLALSASAESSGFGRPGGYVSGGVGGATETFAGVLNLSGTGIDVGTALMIGGRIGYRANKYLAIEAGADYSINGFELQSPTVGSVEAKALVATANLKIYAGDWRIQPFIMGGAGLVRGTTECRTAAGVPFSCLLLGLSDSANVFGGRAGGGLDIYITRNIALSGEVAYVIPTGALSDLNFLTFGGQLMFRF